MAVSRGISLGSAISYRNDFFELRFSAFVHSAPLQRICAHGPPIMSHQVPDNPARAAWRRAFTWRSRCRK
ncbi:hypothetical protein X947_3958 [Burkholderia pseudomallei MSHR7334]|nr:hypothetical protein X947_3958 [Burkholderia pseudomallei MSHR7334]KGW97557.1 hypothetical protein Y030_5897 [Burkholderia pseudomallei MSHR332]